MLVLLRIAAVVVIIMLCLSSIAFAEQKSSCGRCRVGSTTITIICENPLKNAELNLNCKSTGWLSRECYKWRGDLKAGENTIYLSKFITEDGKKFNPNEYDPTNLSVSRYLDTSDFSYFDFTKSR